MEQVNILDMIPGNMYFIDYDGYKYNSYIYLGKHFYRMDDAQYMFERNYTTEKKIKNNKLYLWSPFHYKICRKTNIRNKILKQVLLSFLDESMSEIISQKYL